MTRADEVPPKVLRLTEYTGMVKHLWRVLASLSDVGPEAANTAARLRHPSAERSNSSHPRSEQLLSVHMPRICLGSVCGHPFLLQFS